MYLETGKCKLDWTEFIGVLWEDGSKLYGYVKAAWSPVQGVLIKKLKKLPRPNKGRRAIDRDIDR
jgi:hypothetical protein